MDEQRADRHDDALVVRRTLAGAYGADAAREMRTRLHQAVNAAQHDRHAERSSTETRLASLVNRRASQ